MVFTHCAIESLYDSLSDMATELDSETLDRGAFLRLVGNWCSILSSASTCTLGKSLNCDNRAALETLLEKTGGVCMRNGSLNEAYLSIVPADFSFKTNCLDEVLQTVDPCEDAYRADIDESLSLEEGSVLVESILEEYLSCGADALRASRATCTQSESGLLYFVFRLLTFSMPHGLGVNLTPADVLLLTSEYRQS